VVHGYPYGCFHWDKGGSQIVVQVYNTRRIGPQAEAARQDGWKQDRHSLQLQVGYHTDIHVFDGYFATRLVRPGVAREYRL